MPYTEEDFAQFTSREGARTYQKSAASKSKKPHRRIRPSAILCLLLIISIGVCIFAFKTSAEQKKQIEKLNTQVTQINQTLTKTQDELGKFKETFGTAELPPLNEDKSNYDEVVGAYEQQIAGLINTLGNVRGELNKVREKAPERPETENQSEQNETRQKVCYLTFDDGPSDNTLKILDILKRYNAKATFFVIGRGNLDYTRRIVDEGHAVALHSNTHEYSNIYTSTDAYFADLQAISDKVYDKTGVRSKLIRFPGGSSNTTSKQYSSGIMTVLTGQVEEKGYSYFDWNIDSEDASGNGIPADTLVNNIKKHDYSQYSDICILCHDTAAKDTTVEALPEMIEHLAAQGYVFEALNENSPEFHHGVNN